MPVSPAEPETPKKPDPKAPTVRPKIEPVKKPKLPEVKPDIPDIEYTGSGIELPLMPAVAAVPVMPALPNVPHVNIPASKQTIDVNFYGANLQGEVPTGVMPLLDEYPIIDIPTVAASVVDKSLRDDVVKQIRAQVQDLGEQEAANRILRFIQMGFPYATDDEQFHREKYFYFEESLYYAKNDCEDRAIFYAYLVHEILGLDVHLIQFTGHECTAVAFHEPVENGTSYEYKGKKFYICDPTYIGAKIGKCMPSYAKESPQIEVWY